MDEFEVLFNRLDKEVSIEDSDQVARQVLADDLTEEAELDVDVMLRQEEDIECSTIAQDIGKSCLKKIRQEVGRRNNILSRRKVRTKGLAAEELEVRQKEIPGVAAFTVTTPVLAGMTTSRDIGSADQGWVCEILYVADSYISAWSLDVFRAVRDIGSGETVRRPAYTIFLGELAPLPPNLTDTYQNRVRDTETRSWLPIEELSSLKAILSDIQILMK